MAKCRSELFCGHSDTYGDLWSALGPNLRAHHVRQFSRKIEGFAVSLSKYTALLPAPAIAEAKIRPTVPVLQIYETRTDSICNLRLLIFNYARKYHDVAPCGADMGPVVLTEQVEVRPSNQGPHWNGAGLAEHREKSQLTIRWFFAGAQYKTILPLEKGILRG